MKVRLCLFLFMLSAAGASAQSTLHKFKRLSRPEKCWVLAHPFRAEKAMKITAEVLSTVDSVKASGSIGSDIAGGKLDAFKHAYWMASLTVNIGRSRALRLGGAHERGNYIDYKRHRLEEKILPDSVSSEMDLRNNVNGADAVQPFEHISKEVIQKRILEKLAKGKLVVIKKDSQGNYLYCDGTPVNMNEWLGKWNIPKCLISSGTE
jgi:hypothetical protein